MIGWLVRFSIHFWKSSVNTNRMEFRDAHLLGAGVIFGNNIEKCILFWYLYASLMRLKLILMDARIN